MIRWCFAYDYHVRYKSLMSASKRSSMIGVTAMLLSGKGYNTESHIKMIMHKEI